MLAEKVVSILEDAEREQMEEQSSKKEEKMPGIKICLNGKGKVIFK